MTGILLITVAIAWLIAVLAATRWVVQRVNSPAMKVMNSLALFPVLLIAPLADELVGKQQFDSLCKQYAVQVIDEKHAMNRRVSFERRSNDVFAKGTAVRIRIDPYIYRDVETKNVLIRFHILTAQGGWLIRALGISETTSPLLFQPGCAPENVFGFQKEFNVTVIN